MSAPDPFRVQATQRAAYAIGVYETQRIAVDGGTVEVALGGGGRHVFVATHPFQSGGDGPDPLTLALGEVGRSVRVWPRGMDGGEEEDERRLGIEQLVHDLRAVKEALEIERWIMVGQSAAGSVALAYALTYGADLNGLVLSCTGSPDLLATETGSVYHPDNPDYENVQAALKDGRWRDVNALIARHPDRLSESRGSFSSRHQRAARRDLERLRLTEKLGAIAVPVLVLVGVHDRAIPPGQGRHLAERIAGARLVEFEDSGHFPYEEEPERFREVLSAFADSIH